MKRFLTVLIITAFFITVSSCSTETAHKSVCLPILMYHHIAPVGNDVATVSAESFDKQMRMLLEMGFHTVSFDEVIAYVDHGAELPEKPVCIVFDDGYESNYTVAFPILERCGIKATVALITSSMGAREYKATGEAIIPHLSWAQAREMYASGLVTFASHTHDMHMSTELEAGSVREYCARLPFESAESYISALVRDHELASAAMRDELGFVPSVFAYPHGVWDAYAENVFRSLGYRVTLISEAGMNTVVYGEPDSLYLLRRYNITEATDFDGLLEAVSRYTA